MNNNLTLEEIVNKLGTSDGLCRMTREEGIINVEELRLTDEGKPRFEIYRGFYMDDFLQFKAEHLEEGPVEDILDRFLSELKLTIYALEDLEEEEIPLFLKEWSDFLNHCSIQTPTPVKTNDYYTGLLNAMESDQTDVMFWY